MDTEGTTAPEGALEPEATGLAETDEAPSVSPEPLTVGNGSQVIAVTINLNIPILGPVVYASRRAMPPAVGGRIFDVVRRVVGGPRPDEAAVAEPEAEQEPEAGTDEEPSEGTDEAIPADPAG
jgi:hypothetical protein